MKYALKEWNSIVEPLGQGQVVAIWRKGGIEDNPSVNQAFEDFNVEQNQFVLFPTRTHQSEEKVKKDYLSFLSDNPGPNRDNQIKIKYWAELGEVIEIKAVEQLIALSNNIVHSNEYLTSSWDLNPDHKGKILILRVHKLLNPILVPYSQDYTGCKSWIELKIDIPKIGSKPVLSYKEYSQKLRTIKTLISKITPPQKVATHKA